MLFLPVFLPLFLFVMLFVIQPCLTGFGTSSFTAQAVPGSQGSSPPYLPTWSSLALLSPFTANTWTAAPHSRCSGSFRKTRKKKKKKREKCAWGEGGINRVKERYQSWQGQPCKLPSCINGSAGIGRVCYFSLSRIIEGFFWTLAFGLLHRLLFSVVWEGQKKTFVDLA